MVGMQDESELEYAKMKDFLSFYAERYLKAKGLPPDKQPIASLEALEKKSMKMALNGLRQAINDCVEMSLHFDHKEVEKLDSELRSRGIVTLSELRRRYSKSYAKITKRGQIKNETEYYLVRNVLHDPTEKAPEVRKLLEELISDYEAA
jgi:predicted ATPase